MRHTIYDQCHCPLPKQEVVCPLFSQVKSEGVKVGVVNEPSACQTAMLETDITSHLRLTLNEDFFQAE